MAHGLVKDPPYHSLLNLRQYPGFKVVFPLAAKYPVYNSKAYAGVKFHDNIALERRHSQYADNAWIGYGLDKFLICGLLYGSHINAYQCPQISGQIGVEQPGKVVVKHTKGSNLVL